MLPEVAMKTLNQISLFAAEAVQIFLVKPVQGIQIQKNGARNLRSKVGISCSL